MNDIFTKISLVFPGIGSQQPQMVKSFYENFPLVKRTFEEASDVLHEDFKSICFSENSAEFLNRIDIAQLALVTANMSVFRVFEQEIGIKPEFCLGHSLGEYVALCASKSILFSDVLKIVKERGRVIREASSMCQGTMMWVVNLPCNQVKEICINLSEGKQKVYISAYDSPMQCSVSGHTELLNKLTRILESKGAIVYPLKFCGPFHSPLMEKACQDMKGVLKEYKFKDPEYKVISNLKAETYRDGKEIETLLPRQLISPIRWQQSIEYMLTQGVSGAIEIGPKDVLKFLIKKISPNIKVVSYNNCKHTDLVKKIFLVEESERLKVIERCMKVAVSTRNYNENHDNYMKNVVESYRIIEVMYLELIKNGKIPDKEMVSQAMNMALMVINEKNAPEDVKRLKLYSILQGKVC